LNGKSSSFDEERQRREITKEVIGILRLPKFVKNAVLYESKMYH